VLGAVPALAADSLTIGYLGLKDDPRHQPYVTYTHIQVAPGDDPVEGANMAVSDLKFVSDAVGQTVAIDQREAPDAAGLSAALSAMSAAGEHFVIVDLPAGLLDPLAAAAKGLPVTLINDSAPDDLLRNRCYPNLLHTAASDRMNADALVQYLRTRNWTKVLVLEGPLDRDKAMAEAFKASAARQRFNVVDTRQFTLAADPANREQNNPLLITGQADYDVVYIADNQGDFARYLPYQTQLPRPIVGSIGLMSSEWAWAWDRDGATQVTSRFNDIAGGRHMTGADWAAWIAAKSVITAYAKAGSTDFAKVDHLLRSDRLKMDGSKGVQLNFRPWDGQMRMPIMLATANAVIAEAPLEGFEHQTNTLDTLGTDEPEHKCQ
jgi:ABC transporter substrate binding protein (PQQ-dependent alcohol dehydrogenase system)